ILDVRHALAWRRGRCLSCACAADVYFSSRTGSLHQVFAAPRIPGCRRALCPCLCSPLSKARHPFRFEFFGGSHSLHPLFDFPFCSDPGRCGGHPPCPRVRSSTARIRNSSLNFAWRFSVKATVFSFGCKEKACAPTFSMVTLSSSPLRLKASCVRVISRWFKIRMACGSTAWPLATLPRAPLSRAAIRPSTRTHPLCDCSGRLLFCGGIPVKNRSLPCKHASFTLCASSSTEHAPQRCCAFVDLHCFSPE